MDPSDAGQAPVEGPQGSGNGSHALRDAAVVDPSSEQSPLGKRKRTEDDEETSPTKKLV